MIDLVKAICPELPEEYKVRTYANHEFWFHIVDDTLCIPPENILRGNFILLDQLIEALHNYTLTGPTKGLWNDSLINGVTYYTEQDCIDAIKKLRTYKVLSCDIETRNTGFDGNKVLLIGFAYSDYDSVVIANLASEKVLFELQQLFNDETITFTWQNGKFDTGRLQYLLGIYARVDEDTMLLHYVGINERKGTHGLKDMAALYLQAPKWEEKLDEFKRKWCLSHKVKLKDFQYDMIPSDILIPYLYRDTCATFQLGKRFKNLARPSAMDIYYKLIKAANVFRDIEIAGCLVDQDYMYQLQDDLDTLIVDAEREVARTAAQVWDPIAYAQETGAKAYVQTFSHKSPKQLKWMLEKVTQTRIASTNADTLKELGERYPEIPFIQAITNLRKYNKYMDTYVMGIQKVLNNDGRVRCTFNLHGTETGRLSCSEPNMQNIPRSKMIKNLFKAPDGYKLVQLDYSQAELRVLAYLSQDEYLRETYREGKDLHDAMALKIFGPDFTKEQRVAAKTVNFGIPYGRGPGSMASKMGMSVADASRTIREWYAAAPGAKRYVDQMRRVPYASTPFATVFGRERHYVITSDNRNHIENEAVNFPISSTASDLTMLSVCSIHDQLIAEGLDARIVNTVHDSIIIECIDEPESLKRVAEIGTETMASMPIKYLCNPVLDFPFKADVEIGQSWGALKEPDWYDEEEDEDGEI